MTNFNHWTNVSVLFSVTVFAFEWRICPIRERILFYSPVNKFPQMFLLESLSEAEKSPNPSQKDVVWVLLTRLVVNWLICWCRFATQSHPFHSCASCITSQELDWCDQESVLQIGKKNVFFAGGSISPEGLFASNTSSLPYPVSTVDGVQYNSLVT